MWAGFRYILLQVCLCVRAGFILSSEDPRNLIWLKYTGNVTLSLKNNFDGIYFWTCVIFTYPNGTSFIHLTLLQQYCVLLVYPYLYLRLILKYHEFFILICNFLTDTRLYLSDLGKLTSECCFGWILKFTKKYFNKYLDIEPHPNHDNLFWVMN